jgi:hypothetical protein
MACGNANHQKAEGREILAAAFFNFRLKIN